MNFTIITLGCKVNQFESQAIASILSESGHTEVSEGEAADLIIINSCAVTAESTRKSRQAFRRAKAKNPGAVTAICGCWSQVSREEAEALGADVIFGSADRRAFAQAVIKAYEERAKLVEVDDALKRRSYEKLPAGRLSGRTRAMLKIEDGCTNFCTYCIIPYSRGPVRSLPVADAVSEAKRIEKSGIKELVITGIEISSYGRDLKDGSDLASLVCALSEAAPTLRLRLGSLEPRIVTREFCEKLKALPGLCGHFHLSLQSGCDATLKRMNRKYDTARFYESVSLLREYFPNCGMTADLITGFPGETEEEFAETLAFIKKCAFSDMHVFPYSVRPDTVAAKMPEQCTNETKHTRASEAIKIAAEMTENYLDSCIGTECSVLFESREKEFSLGHAENYRLVRVEQPGLCGEVRRVKITGRAGAVLMGEVF
jgi:threonylcarbamoyladenosine tRNA methylthiotransferase MtaB